VKKNMNPSLVVALGERSTQTKFAHLGQPKAGKSYPKKQDNKSVRQIVLGQSEVEANLFVKRGPRAKTSPGYTEL